MGDAECEEDEEQPESQSQAPRHRNVQSTINQLRAQQVTTLMVRNLPFTVTQKRLVEELAESGFEGQYDFCYMPSTFGTGAGKGYAFINFTSTAAVSAFVHSWHRSRRFQIAASDSALNVSAATLQGRHQ